MSCCHYVISCLTLSRVIPLHRLDKFLSAWIGKLQVGLALVPLGDKPLLSLLITRSVTCVYYAHFPTFLLEVTVPWSWEMGEWMYKEMETDDGAAEMDV